jgi:hypothetical protein
MCWRGVQGEKRQTRLWSRDQIRGSGSLAIAPPAVSLVESLEEIYATLRLNPGLGRITCFCIQMAYEAMPRSFGPHGAGRTSGGSSQCFMQHVETTGEYLQLPAFAS